MISFLQGDCRTVLPTLPAASVQCCVTSPPYYGLRDYGVAGQIGLEQSPQEYVEKLVAVFREVRRVLRPDGTLWLNLGDSYCADVRKGRAHMGVGKNSAHNTWFNRQPVGLKPKDLVGAPWRVAFALQADGWWLRSDIIWSKAAPMPESVRDRPTSAHEHVFLLTKAERYFYDADAVAEPALTVGAKRTFPGAGLGIDERKANGLGGSGGVSAAGTRNLRNVWHLSPEPFPGAHFATMPPTLAERCIKAGTSENGQCPCCGSPWARVVERSSENMSNAAKAGTVIVGKGHVSSQVRDNHDIRNGPTARVTTIGWSPSCACPAHEPVPQTVLDPFAGAATTLLAADRLQRHGIGIELSPDYLAIARRRIQADAPLLTEVA